MQSSHFAHGPHERTQRQVEQDEEWDVKRTVSGRKIWVNHRIRKTSWVDPVTHAVSKVNMNPLDSGDCELWLIA